jgi:glycopeptide antibiotics resistance protein
LKTKTAIRRLGILLFVTYILLLLYFLFFSEEFGRTALVQQEYRYNLHPFRELKRFWVYRRQLGNLAVAVNLFGNVIGFLPFGFMLPVILRSTRSFWVITLSGFSLSLLVELVQLITKVGCFDVDDLILNTLGAVIGYVLFKICNEIRRKYGKKI